MSFIEKIQHVQKQILSILEDESLQPDEVLKKQAEFVTTSDPQIIRGLSEGLPSSHFDRTVVLFSRLSLHFEGGFLVENMDGQWMAKAQFYKGHIEAFPFGKQQIIPVPSESHLLEFKKTKARPILEKIGITNWSEIDNLTCLSLKMSPDYIFVLFSLAPDLWLETLCEQIQKSLAEGISL